MGIQPTGSQDLRFCAAGPGFLAIFVEPRLPVGSAELAAEAFRNYHRVNLKLSLEMCRTTWVRFSGSDGENILGERGFRYDVVNAVLAAGWSDRPTHCSALPPGRFREDGGRVRGPVSAFNGRLPDQTGCGNICEPGGVVDRWEQKLHVAFKEVRQRPKAALKRRLRGALRAIAGLRHPIDDSLQCNGDGRGRGRSRKQAGPHKGYLRLYGGGRRFSCQRSPLSTIRMGYGSCPLAIV
jgi:glycyl-tRNA synthetase beta chain